MTLYFNSKDEYNNYYKTLINNDRFEEHKTENKEQSSLDPQGDNKVYYTYRQFVIVIKFDGEEDIDESSDTFEPFYKPPYYQIIGKFEQIQYDRPLILLDYKNDIIKYKNEIIKYIDDKEYEDEGTESQKL